MALSSVAVAVFAQQRPPIPAESVVLAPPYADYADFVLASPIVADVSIRSVTRLKGPDAVGLSSGEARLYVEADVLALIRGAAPLPPRIAYVVDVPVDSRGRLPRLRKARMLLFARPVPHNPALIQLVRPDAQRDWTPGADALARRITQEVLATDAPPEVTGIGNAFHVAGDLPGAGETQIFLSTADGRPVSISIQRQPGEQPRWSVALSEIVDESAVPPARDTLLWYRLACALPAALPDSSLASVDEEAAKIAREDYRFVIRSLGPCTRSVRP
ncbi:MAG: hypothetical protein JWN66_4789 [Sphingomonas bacterium]|jgi:hypothetical protein|uniref:hypothetical protein n=1 Tax=Sphingomonas bacterium TaxID=1895847 RepID=UPI00260BDE6D|nr:hypothetical protein [Sphingomonas bacterium]MDB5707673.1 hypothetical protein [Sphingomonas bacterium]